MTTSKNLVLKQLLKQYLDLSLFVKINVEQLYQDGLMSTKLQETGLYSGIAFGFITINLKLDEFQK